MIALLVKSNKKNTEKKSFWFFFFIIVFDTVMTKTIYLAHLYTKYYQNCYPIVKNEQWNLKKKCNTRKMYLNV